MKHQHSVRTVICLLAIATIVSSLVYMESPNRNAHAAPATQPAPLPTLADLQQMHDAGEFRTCLQQISRLLALRANAAKQFDPDALLILRGDCLLHLEDRTTALEAYKAAAKTTEPRLAAEARATALLIERSQGLSFKPTFPVDAAPIGIVDHQTRKAAMLALMKEIQLDDKAMIQSALDAQNLAPVIKTAPILIDIYALEFTATGSDRQIHPTLAAVGQRTRDLISRELTIVDARITAIENKANQPITTPIAGAWWSATARQGLTTVDRDALRSDGAYVEQISTTAMECQRISKVLGNTGEKWEPVINGCAEVAGHARAVLLAE